MATAHRSETRPTPSGEVARGEPAARPGRRPHEQPDADARPTAYPVTLPSIRDPRLQVAAVIVTIHVLGQVALDFHVSVPQILAAILTCAVIEVALTFRRQPVVRVAGQRDADRERRGADPPRAQHAAGRSLDDPPLVRVRWRRRRLAADEVRHPLPRVAPVQPVEHRARRRLPRARQHPGRAARLLVVTAGRADDRWPTPSS